MCSLLHITGPCLELRTVCSAGACLVAKKLLSVQNGWQGKGLKLGEVLQPLPKDPLQGPGCQTIPVHTGYHAGTAQPMTTIAGVANTPFCMIQVGNLICISDILC